MAHKQAHTDNHTVADLIALHQITLTVRTPRRAPRQGSWRATPVPYTLHCEGRTLTSQTVTREPLTCEQALDEHLAYLQVFREDPRRVNAVLWERACIQQRLLHRFLGPHLDAFIHASTATHDDRWKH